MPNYGKMQKHKLQRIKDEAVVLYGQGLTMDEVAKRIGWSRSFVNDAIQADRRTKGIGDN